MRTSATTWSRVLVVAPLTLVGVVGCGNDSDDEPQLPNPAAVFCVDQGGESVIVTDDDGSQRGVCRLPDGSEVDEWEYYRQFHDASGNTITSVNP